MEERSPRDTRRETLVTLLTLATNEGEFVSRARRDLESTLWWYGIALNPAEMRLISSYLDERDGLSDDDLVGGLPGTDEALGRW